MTKAFLHTGTALILSAAAQMLVSPVWAQDTTPVDAAAAPEEAAPSEIVVTAQKRTERLQDIPLAVSVIGGDALEASARPSIEGAAQLVPALNFLKSGTTLNQTIFLRGVGTASFSIAGEPSVSTVVDGVVFARSGEAFSDLIDVARLEVLRGPQGTLFGKNASAGVINITTRQPEREFGGTVDASLFEGEEYRVKGAINVPLSADGNLLSRFTGFYGSYDGNIRNVTLGRDVNGYRHYGGRAQFVYEPSSDLRVALTGDYHKNKDDCCAEIIATGPLTGAGLPGSSLAFTVLPTPRGDKTRRITQNLVTRTEEEGWGVSLQADIALGSHTLTSISSYREWDNLEVRDGDWLDRAYVGFIQLHDTGPQTTDTLTQELRITSPADQVISYVIGGYYSKADSRRIFQRDDVVCSAIAGAPTNVLIPCGSANANPSTFPTGVADFGSSFKNLAAFGQATLNATDNFRLIGGLRYARDKLSVFLSRNTTLAGPGIQPSFPVTPTGTGQPATQFRDRTSENDLSGKFAAQFDFTPDHMGYLSYTRGYKGPAYNVFFNLTATGTNRIDPETSDAFEIGLKNTLFDGTMTLNLALFRADYHNFQANNPDIVAGVVVTRFTNAGEVSTHGIEADLSWRPFEDFTLNGGVAFTKARVDQFRVAPGAAPTAVIPSGTPLAFAPKWKGSLSTDYRARTGGAIDVFLGASSNFQSKQLSVFAPNAVQRQLGTIDGYGLVNLSLGVGDADGRYRLTLQARNVFDTSYAAAIATGGPGGSYRYQIPRDADRYFGVNGRFSF
ncbi:MAG: TonB-dependent receptor [Novosphingobium sp.]|nr:TonB-dependent receptor [Novosphingobium sp.]